MNPKDKPEDEDVDAFVTHQGLLNARPTEMMTDFNFDLQINKDPYRCKVKCYLVTFHQND